MSKLKTALREFAYRDLDKLVKEAIHEDWENASAYEGLFLFFDGEEWASQRTFDTAAEIIGMFGLEDEIGLDSVEDITPEVLEKRWNDVDGVFADIEGALNDSDSMKRLNRQSEVAWNGGPQYAAGDEGTRFGLTFSSSMDDLKKLREMFPAKGAADETVEEEVPAEEAVSEEEVAEEVEQIIEDEAAAPIKEVEVVEEVTEEPAAEKKAASVRVANNPKTQCIGRALSFLQQATFDYGQDTDFLLLDRARRELSDCGIRSKKLSDAIAFFRVDRKASRDLVLGSLDRTGVMDELRELSGVGIDMPDPEDLVMTASAAPEKILIDGRIYVRADLHTAKKEKKKKKDDGKTESRGGKGKKMPQKKPDELKNVRPCSPADIDPKKPAKDQVWCVFTHPKAKGGQRLRARYSTEDEAINYKLLMIRRWLGSKRNREEGTASKPYKKKKK